MSEINTPSNPSKYLPLKLSKKDFNQYKEKLEKFLSIKKEEYKNLFESFDILKQKNFIYHSYFFLIIIPGYFHIFLTIKLLEEIYFLRLLKFLLYSKN